MIYKYSFFKHLKFTMISSPIVRNLLHMYVEHISHVREKSEKNGIIREDKHFKCGFKTKSHIILRIFLKFEIVSMFY